MKSERIGNSEQFKHDMAYLMVLSTSDVKFQIYLDFRIERKKPEPI
jgi:hypothetical protein